MNYKKKTKIALLITSILTVVITGSAFAFGAGFATKNNDLIEMEILYSNVTEYSHSEQIKWGDRTYSPSTDYQDGFKVGKQIGIIHDGKYHYNIYECEGLSTGRYLVSNYDVIMSTYDLFAADANYLTLAEAEKMNSQPQSTVRTYLGEANGILSGFWGDIYELADGRQAILYYGSDSHVENIVVKSNALNPQITLYEYDGNPGSEFGETLTKEETGWVRLTGMVFIEVKVPDGAMSVQTYYAEAGTEAASHQMFDSKYSAPHKNPPVSTDDFLTGNSFNVADYYHDGFLGHIWAVITDADGVEHSSEIINVIYEPGKSYTSITGNIINGNVSAINVEFSIVWEGLSPRKYTSTDKIQAVTDYVNGLKLKEFPEKENTYNGATFTITVSYDDGTEEVFYHAGNMLFGYNINGEFTWKRMEYEEAAKFDSIIRNNPSD